MASHGTWRLIGLFELLSISGTVIGIFFIRSVVRRVNLKDGCRRK